MPGHYSDETPLHPDEEGLASIKKAAWTGFKAVSGPIGMGADVILDQNTRGDLYITKPKWKEALNLIPYAVPAIQRKSSDSSATVPPDYEGIINQAEIYGTSRFNQQKIPSYENRPVYIPPEERIGTQKGEPLMTTTGGDKPIPPSDNPLYKKGQKRNEQAKTTKGVIYPIVKDFGGSEVQAKEIWKKVNAEFQDVQKATSKLNELYRKWEPNSKIDIIENEDGTLKVGIVPRHNIALPGEKPRYKASWQFEKDHIRAVMNKYGESRGMNMAENMEIIFGKINREKSNLYQLPEDILSELAVPKNINEYIFNELHPEYKTLQSKIPQRFKESFTKNVLNDFYEQVYGGQPYKHDVKPTVGKKKWPSIMRNITQKYARLYKDEKFLINLTMLDDQPFWERAGDEIPQWAQLLKMPRNKKDPFWMQLPPKAQKRWIRMVEEKKKSIQTPLPVEGGLRRTMSKEKFYKLIDEIFPDD